MVLSGKVRELQFASVVSREQRVISIATMIVGAMQWPP
jgi:hypothetical protein